MMAKPMKTLELHYPMIQFLIKGFTGDYKGLQGITRVYTGIQGYTGVCRGLQGYTRV